jgi:N-acetylgalactosamine kinase
MRGTDEIGAMADLFADAFSGRRPEWFVRVPGRINLIGEHTDYNGYPVLPMAIDRSLRLAAVPREDGRVELKNADRFRYGPRHFRLAEQISPYGGGDWGDYFKAAAESVVGLALSWGRQVGGLRGVTCLVDGDVPPAAGLSSSTALVVAAGLLLCAVNELQPSREALAERMAVAEHYVGTQGGGMDQAVCLLARTGEALKVDFFPLRTEHIPFPPDHVIVAAHSTVRAEKTGRRRLHYNRRVLECNLGAHLLGRELGVDRPEREETIRLADLAARTGRTPSQMTELLADLVDGEESLTLRRAAGLFEMEPGEFARRFLRMKDGAMLPMPGHGLRVLPRCRHVFSEAERTVRAARCLRGGELEQFGLLMHRSHRSCAEDFEISVPELDELVLIMREAGGLGARLTGAGFGGFAIALVAEDTADEVTRAVERDFYRPRNVPLEDNVFAFRPSQGAARERL